MRRVAVGLVLLVALAGCTPSAAFVRSERSAYEAIAPIYRDYVEADEILTPSERKGRLATLEAWDDHLREAEGE